MSECRFDLSQIGEADRHNLAVTFLEATLRFYEDPENVKRFEAWMAAQEHGAPDNQKY